MAEIPKSEAGATDHVVVHTIDPDDIAGEIKGPAKIVRPNEEPVRSEKKAATPISAPSEVNLPPVTSRIAQQALDDWGLRVVDAEQDGQALFIVIEGNHIEDVMGSEGRKLAYDSRFHYGWADSGVEPYGGPNLVEGTTKYRQTWRLTRSSI